MTTEPSLSPRQRATAMSTRKLLEAAVDLIGEKGYESTTLVAIGHHAGYSHGLVTARFGSKDGLLTALLDRMTGEWTLEQMAPRTRPELGLAAVEGLLGAIGKSVTKNPAELRALYALMFEAFHIAALREPVLEMHRQLHATISKALQVAATDGAIPAGTDCDLEARLVVASLRGAAYQWLMDPDYPYVDVLAGQARATTERLGRT